MAQTRYKLWAQSCAGVESSKPQCQMEFVQISEKSEQILWSSSQMIISVP